MPKHLLHKIDHSVEQYQHLSASLNSSGRKIFLSCGIVTAVPRATGVFCFVSLASVLFSFLHPSHVSDSIVTSDANKPAIRGEPHQHYFTLNVSWVCLRNGTNFVSNFLLLDFFLLAARRFRDIWVLNTWTQLTSGEHSTHTTQHLQQLHSVSCCLVLEYLFYSSYSSVNPLS